MQCNAPTPPSEFPCLAYWTQYISYLGNPLGGVGASNMIDIANFKAFNKLLLYVKCEFKSKTFPKAILISSPITQL